MLTSPISILFFFNDTATTEIYTLSLHDALPILIALGKDGARLVSTLPLRFSATQNANGRVQPRGLTGNTGEQVDRKSTRLNSSHSQISYAVFCLKKKKKKERDKNQRTR